MRLCKVDKDIEDYGLSQWFNNGALYTVEDSHEGGYNLIIAEGGVRLADCRILEEYHNISVEELIENAHLEQ